MWVVEVIRYGNPELGIHFYGVFDNYDLIYPTMKEYNNFRGGKYPAYYVTKISGLNPKDCDFSERILIQFGKAK